MNPRVSIIYLTKNGGANFRQSLESVFHQNVNFPFEVIAIDSGSIDSTLEISADYDVRVEHIAPDAFNFGLTRDYGFSLARGRILVTLSQDAVPANSDWLQNLCKPFQDPTIAAVQGREIPWSEREIFFWDKIGVFHLVRVSKRWAKLHQGLGLSFVNCAVRRSVWEKNRLGRVEMSEDKVFQKMLAEQKHRIVNAREARVWHSHNYDLKSLVKRCKNEGLGWENANMGYSRIDMLLDMFHPAILLILVYGLLTFQIRSPSEFLFPWIRPFYLYKGNHYTGSYII